MVPVPSSVDILVLKEPLSVCRLSTFDSSVANLVEKPPLASLKEPLIPAAVNDAADEKPDAAADDDTAVVKVSPFKFKEPLILTEPVNW